jgi:hypothetical protein
MADKKFRSDRDRDSIAELARLIGRADPHAESAPADSDLREEIASECDDESPQIPPAPQLPVDLNASEQAYEHRHGDQACNAVDPHCTAREEHQIEVPRARRRSLALVMAILGLALVGTAGAFGYRDIFGGSSSEPNKVALASSEPQAKDDTATTGSIANLVSRKEEPAKIKPSKAAPRGFSSRVGTAVTPTKPPAVQVVPPTITGSPPGQSGAADVGAAADRAHLAAAPLALANASGAASVTSPVLGSGYAVQITSERSEARAQAAFRALQAKYRNQLSGRQMVIRRIELGASGTYYRALIGPFASAEKAAKLCSGLKTAGGDCIVQKN